MNRSLFVLLPFMSVLCSAQSKPTGACPFIGFESDRHEEPVLAEVATKTPARTWMNCDSPKGCFPGKAAPGSPVLVYRTEGDWVCGYGADRHGAGSAWFFAKDLRPAPFDGNPPIAAWYGTWQGGEDRVLISRTHGAQLHLIGDATWHGAAENDHFGDTRGDAAPTGNRLHYEQEGCVIDLTLAGKYMLADDNQGCGGLNARFTGFWRRVPSGRKRSIRAH